jgi:hypothetical protein
MPHNGFVVDPSRSVDTLGGKMGTFGEYIRGFAAIAAI